MKPKRLLCALVTFTIVQCSYSAVARLSLADWNSYNFYEPSGPGTYSFGYDIDDPATNNVQFRNEERHPNGTVSGSYGYVEPDGNVRLVRYVADHRGYRAFEENLDRFSKLKIMKHSDTPVYFSNDISRYLQEWKPHYQSYPPFRYYIPRN